MKLRPFISMIFAAGLSLCSGFAMADIDNTATASGRYGDLVINSLTSSQSVPVVAGAPSIIVTKSDDTSGFSDPVRAGDKIEYEFLVQNTGNVTLQDVMLTDTALSLDSPPAFVSADKGSVEGTLQVGEIATYTATYEVTQDDIDTGEVVNWADVASKGPLDDTVIADLSDDPEDSTDADTDGDGNPDDVTRTELAQVPDLMLEKVSPSFEQAFVFIYDITYDFSLKNKGNQTLTDIALLDDLRAAFEPGEVVSIEKLIVTGFDGAVAPNPNFDGDADKALFDGLGVLAPDEEADVNLIVRVDFANGITENDNIALAQAAQLSEAVVSTDPTDLSNIVDPETGVTTEPSPTPHNIVDTDLDGAPDGAETEGDRDGDGIPNNVDYDPHGYFYCEENGNILEGGLITVTGPLGSQTGVGTSNNIRIVKDGTDGVYQWYATAVGNYTMTYQLPTSGVASETRLTLGELDTTTINLDPYSVGSSEFGTSRKIADFTASANPFYTSFDIQVGAPLILNNNIPLQFCGTPELSARKEVIGDVTFGADLTSRVTYEIGIENIGDTRVVLPTMVDDLDAAFGVGRHAVLAARLVAAPSGFTGVLNPGFNGSSDTSILSSAGYIEPGEEITVQLDLSVDAPTAGAYENTVEVGGSSPLTGDVLEPTTASVSVNLFPAPDRDSIKVTKTAGVSSVMLGGSVPYTLTYENTNAFDLTGVAFVDQLPGGFVYKPQSATLDGQPIEPSFDGRRLIWPNQTLAADTTVTIQLTAFAGAGIDGTSFVNKTWVEELSTGRVMSQIATAEVAREAEAIFECSDVIGTVFEDGNMNGYQDGATGAQSGETGLSGVRISTTTGTLISTDAHGRFNVPCAATPDALGDNVILKLDTRSLPEGYIVTTENPRSVRLTAGKIAKLNFGAAQARLLEIDLSARAFVNDAMTPELENGLKQLLLFARTTPSKIDLNYFENGEPRSVINGRMRRVERFINREWRAGNGAYELVIDKSVRPLR